MTRRHAAVASSGNLWQRAAGGVVASASFQAEVSAVRRGLLASRIVAAALRAEAGDLNDLDADALDTLVGLLDVSTTELRGAGSRDLVAFAAAMHEAAPQPREQPAKSLGDIAEDARVLLAAANATGRTRTKLLRDPELAKAARRLVTRFAAVSESAMAEAGGPGDSIGTIGR